MINQSDTKMLELFFPPPALPLVWCGLSLLIRGNWSLSAPFLPRYTSRQAPTLRSPNSLSFIVCS